MHPQESALRTGAQALGLSLDERQVGQLLAYLDLLGKWNKVYNLTAVRDPGQMLVQHLLDSLSIVAPLHAHAGARSLRLLDVGSGGGLPGVVIAVCCPRIDVTCVDTVGKKAAFVQQVAGTLALANLRGRHDRVEAITESFDVIVSRAFASLVDFTAWSAGALAEGGVWLAMKGRQPDGEIAALWPWVEVFHVEQLAVPGLDAERCLVWLRRAG